MRLDELGEGISQVEGKANEGRLGGELEEERGGGRAKGGKTIIEGGPVPPRQCCE